MLSWFNKKKDEPDFDPSNPALKDIRKGFFLDFDFKSYEVKKEYTYDWGDNYFTKEYQLVHPDDTFYLHIEDDDELELTVTRPVKMGRLYDGNLVEYLTENEQPPKELEYDGKTFFLDTEEAGYLNEEGTEAWQEFLSWDYYDESETFVLNIEQWGERDFSASFGKLVDEYDFTHILPGAQE